MPAHPNRKLRIAWSVGCGVMCLLLVVLWVRSYWWHDTISSPYLTVRFGSNSGTLSVTRTYFGVFMSPDARVSWSFQSEDAETAKTKFVSYTVHGPDSPPARWPRYHREFHVATWLPVVLTIVAAVGPWASLRFSLRTLLVATTLVALLLGGIAALAR